MSIKLKNTYLSFHRLELNLINSVYGRGVAVGVWKDYAIDMLDGIAVFSIYKNASERPIFQIIKDPKLRNKQGQYKVTTVNGKVLKRGEELEQVLKVLDRFKTHLSIV